MKRALLFIGIIGAGVSILYLSWIREGTVQKGAGIAVETGPAEISKPPQDFVKQPLVAGQEKKSIQEEPAASTTIATGTSNNIRTELRGQRGQAYRIYSGADEALSYILNERGKSSDTLLEFSQIHGDCSWCPELYQKLRALASDPSRPRDERQYLTLFLAATGDVAAAQVLLDTGMRESELKPGNIFFEAIGTMHQTSDIVSLYNQMLAERGDTQLREALVAGLGFGHSIDAARALYEDLVRHDDTDGFASAKLGLSYFNADSSALPYLSSVVEKEDKFSVVAFRSLLNSWSPGVKAAFDILQAHPNDPFYGELVKDAPNFVRRIDPASSTYLKAIWESAGPKTNAHQLADTLLVKLGG